MHVQTARFAAFFCLITMLLPQLCSALPLTPGNIITSNSPFGDLDLFEFTPAGTFVQEFQVTPAGDGRDLVIDRDGRVQLYHGTFSPVLTQFDAATNTFDSRSFAGWSTVNNLTYGGIGAFGQYIFATDMATANAGSPQGVVRFDLDGGPTVRFATNLEPLDLYVGLDGLLYTLSRGSAFNGGGNRIDVFDPQSMAFVRTFNLQEEHRGIAVDADGEIYTAQRDNVSRVNRFSPTGAFLDSINDPGVGGLADIDINRDGGLLITSHGGTMLVTTTALDSINTIPARFSNGTAFGAWVQAPVPEPAMVGLIMAAMPALLRLRRPGRNAKTA